MMMPAAAPRVRSSVSRRTWGANVDRRRPRPFLIRRQTVVFVRRAEIAVAWVHLDAVAFVVVLAPQVAGVHGQRRFLHRTGVVNEFTTTRDKVRIVELHRATGWISGALEAAPWIFDQRAHRVATSFLWADPHDLDTRDP